MPGELNLRKYSDKYPRELCVKYGVELIDEFKHVLIWKAAFLEEVSVLSEWQQQETLGSARHRGYSSKAGLAQQPVLYLVQIRYLPSICCLYIRPLISVASRTPQTKSG